MLLFQLSFEQIIDLVNAEDIEYTSDDSSEEVLPVQLKEAQMDLETAINFQAAIRQCRFSYQRLSYFLKVFEFTKCQRISIKTATKN